MKRATTIANRAEEAIETKQQLFKNVEIAAPLTINQRPLKPGQNVLSVDELVLQQDGVILNQPLSFTLEAGQQVALTGINGAGKSTLIKALLALPATDHIASGSLHLNPHLTLSYLPQDFDQLSGSLADFAAAKQVDHEQLLSMLRKLGFDRDLFTHRLETMSMGQKRKAALARSLCEEADCYLWDEPLNYLDVITREQVQTLIAEQRPTLLFIEHDVDFVNAIATQTYALRPQH